uniref:3'-5' exoribonuclease 1 n=1 Tax=Cacopsylla melanoneura TaxID=428564 RepID=A0A8D8YQ67_9HEMI
MEDSLSTEDEAEITEENTLNDSTLSTDMSAQVTSIPLTNCPFDDKIFKELSIINGQINAMKRKDLVPKLKKYHLNHKGDVMVLRKRLKNHFKVTKLTKAKLMEKYNLPPYYVVIDFEATCQENNPVDFKYEIIEFPAILVHTESLKIVDVFHSFVRPVINPKLTAFCQQLTGITQKKVDNAPKFPDVLKKFESWLDSHGLLTERKFIVTDGPWDMGRFFFLQCKLSKLPYPAYAREWTNLRKIFRNFYKYHQGGTLEDMVKFVGLKFEGDPHRGLDDSYNIARMFLHLLKDGALIRVNERITNHARSHNNMHVVPVPYKSPYNTLDEVQTLRTSLATLSLSLDPSDTEPSEPESAAEEDSTVCVTKESSEKRLSGDSGKRSSISGSLESECNETGGKNHELKRKEKEHDHGEENKNEKKRGMGKTKNNPADNSECENEIERIENEKNRVDKIGAENRGDKISRDKSRAVRSENNPKKIETSRIENQSNLSDKIESNSSCRKKPCSSNTDKSQLSSTETLKKNRNGEIDRKKDKFLEENSEEETSRRIEKILNNNGLLPVIRIGNKEKTKDSSKRNSGESNKDPIEVAQKLAL